GQGQTERIAERIRRAVGDIGATALPHLDETIFGQGPHRFPDDISADTVDPGQITLVRQPITRDEFALDDPLTYRMHDALVEPNLSKMLYVHHTIGRMTGSPHLM